jgi:hypothetical protein
MRRNWSRNPYKTKQKKVCENEINLLTCCGSYLQADKEKKAFYTLRVARSDVKLIGKREVRAKKKAIEEAEAAKTKA